ncbi:hypothetical protein [Microbacterium sp. CFBP9034]|uniref:hypothetical protein n=1 Tax=Microbacterium sp. CFBP9034 TaxID=3096540 RepID=UPI002A6AF245|nr:hypothetical protein [Microbacterium sp. CFBP9034]MDY0908137.1 hypothetical protein [Microbacterium sp. CFBP9034]
MRRWLPALILVALLTGCASAGTPPEGTPPEGTPPDGSASPSASPQPSASAAVPVPRFIGPVDDGRTYAMTVGETTALQLVDPDAPEPELEGTSVLLILVTNVAGGDAREWEVRAVEPGASVLRGSESGAPWAITITVSE